MSRTAGSSGPKTVAAIRKAGLQLIYEHGYEAMSLRQLAAEVGIQQGSLYNHIRTKQELLLDLITVHMNDLLRELDEALSQGGTAVERLKAFVHFHVGYHVNRKQEVFICYSELRSLEPANFTTISDMRRVYELKLTEILEAGVAEGSFMSIDMKVAAYGILSMLSGICTWFSPGGRLSESEVAHLFTTMVLNSVLRHGEAGEASTGKPVLKRVGART
ncbi:TetR/AcrR family transcriptional regulator [Microvirga pudoricolor]|uniref:TetR/AcrR family transcriptional regulator n=1 Tax=Microvirga pudoricolor TaxID=2778729 RepID=UPI0019512060|nr:TetR/AcrR family transcriptional regulator [Microvirga pudoricolor]MBM6596476.1 TetR family transcriptional regulator [Microvirga pudoricolor]